MTQSPSTEDDFRTSEELARIDARAARRAELDFWRSRRILRHLYRSSCTLVSSPWALLGGTILRALHTVPYHVQYHSALAPGSLNTVAVFMADSGGGKTVLQAQLNEILSFGRGFVTRSPGSGEAIAETYVNSVDRDSGAVKWRDPGRAEMFSFDEVGMIAAMKKRGGSTVLEYLKIGWSGGRLGRVLVGEKGVELPEHEYRLTAFINAQHDRADVLLNSDEIAGGFPGRLLWVNMQDPSVVDRYKKAEIKRLRVRLPDWPARDAANGRNGFFRVQALPQMDEAHLAERRGFHLGTRDALHGHELMVRVRVAVALMVLDRRTELNDEDWDLAETVMTHSRNTRALVRQRLADLAAKSVTASGRAAGKQKFAEQESFAEEELEKARDQFNRAVLAIQDRGDNVTQSRVKKPMTASLSQKYFQELWREWEEQPK